MVTLSKVDKAMICAAYKHGDATQEQLANTFGVSRTQVRRALADADLVIYKSHKTPEQEQILSFLEANNITSLSHLKQLLETK